MSRLCLLIPVVGVITAQAAFDGLKFDGLKLDGLNFPDLDKFGKFDFFDRKNTTKTTTKNSKDDNDGGDCPSTPDEPSFVCPNPTEYSRDFGTWIGDGDFSVKTWCTDGSGNNAPAFQTPRISDCSSSSQPTVVLPGTPYRSFVRMEATQTEAFVEPLVRIRVQARLSGVPALSTAIKVTAVDTDTLPADSWTCTIFGNDGGAAAQVGFDCLGANVSVPGADSGSTGIQWQWDGAQGDYEWSAVALTPCDVETDLASFAIPG